MRLGYNPPPLPCNSTPQTVQGRPATATGLTGFQADIARGYWFGPGSGQGDRWGVVPSMMNASAATPTGLRLTLQDTVAREAGFAFATPFTDYEGYARPQGASWDIGASEAGGAGPAAPLLLSVQPVP